MTRWGWCGPPSKVEAEAAFSYLQGTLEHLRLVETKPKAFPPSQVMTWLGLQFDTINLTITRPKVKLAEIANLVADWQGYSYTNIRALRTLLGKLVHITQCCIPARNFLNRVLETLMSRF